MQWFLTQSSLLHTGLFFLFFSLHQLTIARNRGENALSHAPNNVPTTNCVY
jgi:hypothetical protein